MQGNLADPRLEGGARRRHCTRLPRGEGSESVSVISERVLNTVKSNWANAPGTYVLFVLGVLCVYTVKRVLAQHPLHQPDPFQHQPGRQQLSADLHRGERGGDDQLLHTAQRPV